jgi:signal peptidase II
MSDEKADPPKAEEPAEKREDEKAFSESASTKEAAPEETGDEEHASDENAAEEPSSEEESSGEKAEPPTDEIAAEKPRDEPSDEEDDDVDAPIVEKPKPRPAYAFLAVASLLFFGADAISKWVVVTYAGGPKPRPTTDGWHLRINEVPLGNKGGAFGFLSDKPEWFRLPFFFIISAVAVVFVVSLYRKLEPKQHALKWALPLLLGGAAGNLVDRIRHQAVIDFIEFSITKGTEDSFKWPTFNVADIWIVVGVILMAVDMFTPRKKVPMRPAVVGPAARVAPDAKEKAAKAEA